MRASARDDEDELDFRLTFGEELGEPRPSAVVSADLDLDEAPAYPMGPCLAVNRPIGIPRRRGPAGRAGMHSPPPRPVTDGDTYESQPARLIHLGGSKVLACPSIQITSISPGACDREDGGGEEAEVADEDGEEAWGLVEAAARERPYLPPDPFGYRGGSLSASPGSSCRSSPGIWPSGAGSPFSSSSSPSSWTPFDDVEPELREAAYRMALAPPPSRWAGDEASSCSASSPSPSSPSPLADDPLRLSPRGPGSGPPSRPTSPCGKRRHSGFEAYSYHQEQPYYQQRGHPSPGRSPSPSRRGSLAAIDDEAPASREGPPSPLLLLHHLLLPPPPASAYQRGASVPVKARRTSQAQRVAPLRQGEGEGEPGGAPYAGTEALAQLQALKKDAGSMEYLTVPSPFVWTKARTAGHSPVFRSSALPPLDWPLPSQYEQLELKMEVQPRTHHRAHYETEGSRGAVKAAAGGHPVVK
ncbi:nuclear factor of activated T-cells, cytoplasmic 4-like, partial [Stegostoma tigrinum]|uniref:nuclear factor of activated T-cells, cytoplasmic 4-like n=1 Tax=Stegostoma tigrinum TaxID=3053191 RepID=UPI0028701E08